MTPAHPLSPHDGLLLVLPVPFKESESGLLCEEQATNGIDQWAEHFAHVTVIAPVLRGDLPRNETIRWRDPATLRNRDKVELVALPMAYTLHTFASSFARGRRILLEHITSHRYLSFAIGGLIGDWAALGARLALSVGRSYSIHTDRVEHQVLLRLASKEAPLRRLKGAGCRIFDAPVSPQHHPGVRIGVVAWWRLFPRIFTLGARKPSYSRHSS